MRPQAREKHPHIEADNHTDQHNQVHKEHYDKTSSSNPVVQIWSPDDSVVHESRDRYKADCYTDQANEGH